MIEQTVYTALTTGSPLPTAAGLRVYPMLMPQEPAYPALTYQRIANDPIASLDGNSNLDRVRLQIDCWALTYLAAKNLAAEVRAEMATIGALLLLDLDDYESNEKVYRVTMDFSLWQAV